MSIAAGDGTEDGGCCASALGGVLLGCEGELLEFVHGGDGGVEESEFERAFQRGFEAVERVVNAGVFDEVEEVGRAEVAGDGEGANGEAEAGEEVEEGGETRVPSLEG
ncbi:MAG: hypothetical protein M5U20_12610 [Phycisphaerales bacterium]|nr:hypothetical protein [Phycisphaerales bacterium]